ncbi:MAG: hypothetical protein OXC09_09785 [Truepera sp.]|nr:hypothetical protein [Truepera sp.]
MSGEQKKPARRPMPTDPKDLARAMFKGVEKIAAKKLSEKKKAE